MRFSNTLAIAPILSVAIASGVPIVVSPGLNISTNPNITSQAPCTNLSNPLAPRPNCYTTLKVKAFLQNYNEIKAETCAPYELWSTCLLRDVYGLPGVNCTATSKTTSECIPFNCSTLAPNGTCPAPTIAGQNNSTNVTIPAMPLDWYAAWNVYNTQNHIYSWATALNANTSTKAILKSVDPRKPNTATQLLTALILRYGYNPNADKALVSLLMAPTNTTEMSYGNSRLRGELSTLSGAQWQVVLYKRLEQANALAMGDFGSWLNMLDNGTYSVRGLAGVGELVEKLKK